MSAVVLRCLARALLAAAAGVATAAPPTPEKVAELCASVEGPAHCGRMIEAEQMKALPNLAKRDGDTLSITLFPAGQRAFVDLAAVNSDKSYALYDYWSPVNAVVLLVTDGDDTSFSILQRTTGQVTELPAEPLLGPDRQRLVVADFCAKCSNELTVWRIARDGIRRELAWKPQPAWSDASVKWKDADTLVLQYTPAGGTESRTQERKLAAADWQRP